MLRRLRRLFPAVIVLAAATACVNVFWQTEIVPLDRDSAASLREVRVPLKAHMADGSTVMFRRGATLSYDQITGEGLRFPLLSSVGTRTDFVQMDSVVALEAFDGKMLTGPTVAATVAATALGAVGLAGLAVAIFGSCPTIYADTGANARLQAEGFSYAIGSLFEHRDVDRLDVTPGADGIIRLELRNEALETHFINQLSLLAVETPLSHTVVPDQRNNPVSVTDVRPLLYARDRAGRDVTGELARADGELYATAPRILEHARAGDLDDFIDIAATDLPQGDSVAVVLRLRNSLLNTVLLYDEMLSGPDAMEWLARDLYRISSAVSLARWYTSTMGMHASVDGDESVARLGDVGPIAFRDVAIVLPRPHSTADSVRIRLRFVADNWRIDRVAIAGTVARPQVRELRLARVVVPQPTTADTAIVDDGALRLLETTDDRYLETRPGQRLVLEFRETESGPFTYAIQWQGWYREWIRRDWARKPSRATAFIPGDGAMLSAMKKWQATKADFERQFYHSMIPVR